MISIYHSIIVYIDDMLWYMVVIVYVVHIHVIMKIMMWTCVGLEVETKQKHVHTNTCTYCNIYMATNTIFINIYMRNNQSHKKYIKYIYKLQITSNIDVLLFTCNCITRPNDAIHVSYGIDES